MGDDVLANYQLGQQWDDDYPTPAHPNSDEFSFFEDVRSLAPSMTLPARPREKGDWCERMIDGYILLTLWECKARLLGVDFDLCSPIGRTLHTRFVCSNKTLTLSTFRTEAKISNACRF